jgi:hypothetical protein
MNAKRILFIPAGLLLLAVLACGGSTATPPTGVSSIGTIQRVSDSLEHNQARVTASERVFPNDSLRLFGGGEGLLDLGNLVLRLFNDTALGGVSVDSAPGQPLFARIYLELGGFTGKLTGAGGQAVFATPGGATIRVYGTTFFLVYDQDSQTTTAGNFDGSLEIESAGATRPVPPGAFSQAQPGQPPSPEQPIPFSIGEFERIARQLASPVAALGQLQPPVVVITPPPLPVDVEPPVFGEVRIEPPEILLGSECPGADGTTQVTVTITDPSGVDRAVAEWRLGGQSGSIEMERLDDQTFTARIGPVQEAGEVLVTIDAWDNNGNPAPALQFSIPAQFCVG